MDESMADCLHHSSQPLHVLHIESLNYTAFQVVSEMILSKYEFTMSEQNIKV
jgi:hypothetical protein